MEQKNQRLEISLKKKSVPHSHKLAWMLGSKEKRERLQSMIGFLGDTPFINPDDVESEAFDARNEHVVCFTSEIGRENDPQMSIDSYLTGNVPPQLNREASTGIDDKNVINGMRQTLKPFAKLKVTNEDHKEVKVFATKESLSHNFIGNCGVFVYLYEDGGLDNNDFKSSPKPEKLEAESVRDDSIELR